MDIKKGSFDNMIARNEMVLVDFHALWCGPCKTMAPVLQDLKKEVGDKLSIIKVDVDKSPAIASRFQIQGVPTFVFFKKGVPVWRQSGAMPLARLKQELMGFMVG